MIVVWLRIVNMQRRFVSHYKQLDIFHRRIEVASLFTLFSKSSYEFGHWFLNSLIRSHPLPISEHLFDIYRLSVLRRG